MAPMSTCSGCPTLECGSADRAFRLLNLKSGPSTCRTQSTTSGSTIARWKTSPLSTRFASRCACSSCRNSLPAPVAFLGEQLVDPRRAARLSRSAVHAVLEDDVAVLVELLFLILRWQVHDRQPPLSDWRRPLHRLCCGRQQPRRRWRSPSPGSRPGSDADGRLRRLSCCSAETAALSATGCGSRVAAVEVHDAVEQPAGADEFVDRLSPGIVLGGSRCGRGADARGDCCADDSHARLVLAQPPDAFLEARDHRFGAGAGRQIVDALEPDDRRQARQSRARRGRAARAPTARRRRAPPASKSSARRPGCRRCRH